MKDLFGAAHTPIFACPFCKAAPQPSNGWPRRWQWKTARGLAQHHCYRDEQSRAAANENARVVREAEFMRLFAEYAIPNAAHKIGAVVAFVSHAVTEPTHQANRWGRTVHVRYEETRHYTARQEVITAIIPASSWHDPGDIGAGLAVGRFPPVHYKARWYEFGDSDIYPTLAEADAAARRAQAAYDESCRFAESCR